MSLARVLTLVRSSSFWKGLVAVVSFPFVVMSVIFRELNIFLSRIYARLERSRWMHHYKGQPEAGRQSVNLCIFAHYDKDDLVDDYVIHYLNALTEAGCDVLFVSTANLGAREIEKISPLCTDIIVRPNIGYDFGSYRTGLEFARDRLTDYDQVILANDSVYGPLYSLGDILTERSPGDADIWSITDSWEHGYHLQSYFLGIRQRILADKKFWRFVERIGYFHRTKWSVIRQYEVRLTSQLLKLGYHAEAMVPYTEVRDKLVNKYSNYTYNSVFDRAYVNPTHFFWFSLIQDFKAPFIKIELIRDNPMHLEGVAGNWQKVVTGSEYANPEIILRHLKRVGAGRGAV